MQYFNRLFFIIFCTLASFNSLFATSVDGTSSIQYLTTNKVFRNNEYARGYVKFNAGATILNDATASFNILSPFSGWLDLRETGTLDLQGNLNFDVNATLSGSGVIRGNGNTIFLNGNLSIPSNSVIHINSDTIIDGLGHDLIFENRGKIFVDTNITLTLQNMRIVQTFNNYSDPCIRLAAFKSSLALSDVELALSQDFLFPQGQLFVHGDVIVTGTSAFVYQSTQHSLIAHDSTFYFDIGATFSVAPATFTDCKFDQWPTYTSNNFLLMADKTSSLHFNQATLCTTPTGCRLSSGTVNFENKCIIKSNSALDLPKPYLSDTGNNISTGNLPSQIAYSPDGNYLAVVNKQSNTLQIFDSVLYTQIGGDVVTGSEPVAVSWSNTSTQLAVANAGDNTVKVFNFTGSATPSISVSQTTGSNPSCVAWSTYGKYIAVTNYDSNTLQIFKADTLSQVGDDVIAEQFPSSVAWAPGDRYLAVTSSGSDKLLIFAFDGFSSPTEIADQLTNITPTSVSWASNGLFLSVANSNSNTLQIFSFDANEVLTLLNAIPTDHTPISSAWSSDGSSLGVVNYSSNTLQFLQFYNQSMIDQIDATATGNMPYSVSWSPDGDFVAVVNNSSGSDALQIFAFDGVSALTLAGSATIGTGSTGASVSWSSSNYVVVVGYSPNILQIFSVDGAGVPSAVVGGSITPAYTPISVSWSPGNYIAVVGQSSNTLEVFSVNGSGVPSSVGSTAQGYAPVSVAWAHAENYIAVVGEDANTLQIFSFNGGTPIYVGVSFSGLSSPKSVSWAPDGNFIAVINYNYPWQLKIFSFDGFTNPSPVSSTTTLRYPTSVSWSPDGRSIAIASSLSNSLQIYTFNGLDNLIQAYNNASTGNNPIVGNIATSVSWSRAGNFIAAVNPGDNTLHAFSPNASGLLSQESTKISTQKGPSSLSFCPDSDCIAVSDSMLNIFQIFQIQDPAVLTQVGIAGTNMVPISASWSPDLRFIAVINQLSNTLQIFYFDNTGNPTLVGSIGGLNSPRSVSWSPDGRFIAAVNFDNNTLKIFSFNGYGSPILVGNALTGLLPRSVSWSPDGMFLAVVDFDSLQIFSFNGDPILVGTVGVLNIPISASWSPDGRFLAVINSDTLQIYSFNEAENPVLVGISDSILSNPQSVSWSPDGRFIAAVNFDNNTLKIFSFNGYGSPILVGHVLTGLLPRSVSWSPDGMFLAVSNEASSTFQIFSFVGNRNPIPVGNSSTVGMPLAVSWSSDGKFIAVTNGVYYALQVFKVNYIPNSSVQAISNGVGFGNSSLGANYDATVNLLAGSNILVDGLINYDCVN